MSRRVFITVAEASGDQHAGNFIQELRALDPTIIVEGLGGDAMRAAGAIIHFDTVKRAAMGWKAALRALEIRKRLKWTAHHFRQYPPDLQICIDSWAMNWHWAKLAHDRHVPVMYYIAPQVWASRPKRIKRLARYVDQIACIHLFEEKYFRDRGVEATFVGHPLFDALPPRDDSQDKYRFPNRPPVIGLLPGSRSSVAKENFPNLLDVADRILQAFPDATFLIPTMPSTHGVVQRWLTDRASKLGQSTEPVPDADDPDQFTVGAFTYRIHGMDKLAPRCDLCLTVSGTATLHVAGHGVPMIVVYRLNPIIWHLAARWIVKTRTYSLVNLLNDSHQDIVPEFVPWYGSNAPVAIKALELLQNPQLLAEQRQKLRHLIRTLNRPGASRNAAKLAMELMTARAQTVLDATVGSQSDAAC